MDMVANITIESQGVRVELRVRSRQPIETLHHQTIRTIFLRHSQSVAAPHSRQEDDTGCLHLLPLNSSILVARLRVKVAVVTIERQASRKHPCVGQEDQEISAVAFDVALKYASVASAALEAFFNFAVHCLHNGEAIPFFVS